MKPFPIPDYRLCYGDVKNKLEPLREGSSNRKKDGHCGRLNLEQKLTGRHPCEHRTHCPWWITAIRKNRTAGNDWPAGRPAGTVRQPDGKHGTALDQTVTAGEIPGNLPIQRFDLTVQIQALTARAPDAPCRKQGTAGTGDHAAPSLPCCGSRTERPCRDFLCPYRPDEADCTSSSRSATREHIITDA